MKRLLLGLLLIAAPLAAQTKDSLISSRVDSVPVYVKTYTNVYLRVPVPTAKLTISPKTVSAVISGASVQFTASQSVTWVATGGPINAAGLYWPGKTAGRYLVIGSSGALADTAVVTISGGVTPPVDTTTPPSGGLTQGFESGWGAFTGGGAGMPVLNATIVTGDACEGTHYFEASLTAGSGDNGVHAYWDTKLNAKKLTVSFCLRIKKTPSQGIAIQKTLTFWSGNSQMGEMNQNSGNLIWNWLDGGYDHVIMPVSALGTGWTRITIVYDNTGAHGVMTATVAGAVKLVSSEATQQAADAKRCACSISFLHTGNLPLGNLNWGGTLNSGSGLSTFDYDALAVSGN